MTKFSVIGSCVSRDVLSFIEGVKIGQYIGRTSIPSMVSQPSSWVSGRPFSYHKEPHPWHEKVLKYDIEKLHRTQMALMRNDYILIDLIEERSGIIEVEASKFVTFSDIIRKLTNYSDHCSFPIIKIFSDEGINIWKQGLERFASMLKEYVSDDQIIIHNAYYANQGSGVSDINKWLAKMYEMLAKQFPNSQPVESKCGNLKSNPSHKWGSAPFHYCDSYYEEIAESVCQIAGIPYIRKPNMTFNIQ